MARPAVFVDTRAHVAVLKRDDVNHQAAIDIVRALTQQRAALFSTNFILAETHALLLRHLGYGPARVFLQQMDASRATVIVQAEETGERAAQSILYRHTDKDFSLVDTISFVVMARLGLTHAFTFDKHFEQYGWQVLRP